MGAGTTQFLKIRTGAESGSAPGRIGSILALMAAPLAGCASSGVAYSGVYADPVRTAGEIQVTPALSEGTELGELRASCDKPSVDIREELIEGVAYGDLVCSEGLLRQAMTDVAAYVGGTHLTQVLCEGEEAQWHCSSLVMRTEDTPVGADGSNKEVSTRLPRKPVRDPWEVEVRLRAKHNDAPVRPAPRQAQMVPRVPLSDWVLGELTVSCRGDGCDEAQLKEAITQGARYAGAVHHGYPECRHRDDRAKCRSWVSAYQIDFRSGQSSR